MAQRPLDRRPGPVRTGLHALLALPVRGVTAGETVGRHHVGDPTSLDRNSVERLDRLRDLFVRRHGLHGHHSSGSTYHDPSSTIVTAGWISRLGNSASCTRSRTSGPVMRTWSP